MHTYIIFLFSLFLTFFFAFFLPPLSLSFSLYIFIMNEYTSHWLSSPFPFSIYHLSPSLSLFLCLPVSFPPTISLSLCPFSTMSHPVSLSLYLCLFSSDYLSLFSYLSSLTFSLFDCLFLLLLPSPSRFVPSPSTISLSFCLFFSLSLLSLPSLFCSVPSLSTNFRLSIISLRLQPHFFRGMEYVLTKTKTTSHLSLSLFLCICLSLFLSICLSLCLSVSPSFYLSLSFSHAFTKKRSPILEMVSF
ncbi:unnamed protein product [Acanthosepion pharaonis]|uniref:Uncharacterized protein n=1 Tax=Acanthosepion pharaonis TaxID=158019 RepID=A0A812ECF2_ACAPH|nr:unnamed protein product [Sepia pharaonis]